MENEIENENINKKEDEKINVLGLKKQIKKIAKSDPKNSQIIEVLKQCGLPGNVAYTYYKNYGTDYLVKKCWQFKYQMINDKPENPIGWLRSLIEHEKYPPPDGFYDFLKREQSNYQPGNYDIMYKVI